MDRAHRATRRRVALQLAREERDASALVAQTRQRQPLRRGGRGAFHPAQRRTAGRGIAIGCPASSWDLAAGAIAVRPMLAAGRAGGQRDQ
jgi:hypothetical protein